MKPDDVLDFWFGADPNVIRNDFWFNSGTAYDAPIRERFSFMLEMARDGALDTWGQTPQGALALVLVLDQFSRHIHRGTPFAFAGDAHARRIAHAGIAGGADARLTPVQRIFLYLPFQHSESMADQDLAVLLYETLHPYPGLEDAIRSAHAHREVIRRFGRFPRRNAALGRSDTADEAAYLAATADAF